MTPEPSQNSSQERAGSAGAEAGQDAPVARPIGPQVPPAPGLSLLTDQSASGALVDVLIVFAVLFALPWGFWALRVLGSTYDASAVGSGVALGIVELALTGCLMICYVLYKNRQSLASIGWTGRRWAMNLLIGVLSAAALFVFGTLFCALLALVWPAAFDYLQANYRRFRSVFAPLDPTGILGLLGIVAVYEELLFRGFLITRLRRIVGSWPAAIVLSAVAFALEHFYQGPIAMLLIVPTGLILAIVFVWRESLIPCIVAHFLFNGLMLALGNWLYQP